MMFHNILWYDFSQQRWVAYDPTVTSTGGDTCTTATTTVPGYVLCNCIYFCPCTDIYVDIVDRILKCGRRHWLVQYIRQLQSCNFNMRMSLKLGGCCHVTDSTLATHSKITKLRYTWHCVLSYYHLCSNAASFCGNQCLWALHFVLFLAMITM